MRLALQRLLAHPSAVSILRNAVRSGGASFCQHHSLPAPTRGQSRGYASQEKETEPLPEPESRAFRITKRHVERVVRIKKHPVKNENLWHDKGPIERSRQGLPDAHAGLPDTQKCEDVNGKALSRSTVQQDVQMFPNQHDLRSDSLSLSNHLDLAINAKRSNKGWRSRLVTLEQYHYESDLEAPALRGPRLLDDPKQFKNWKLWLDLIVFRKRHHGANCTVMICSELLRRPSLLPTLGDLANQLWDLLIGAGVCEPNFLEEVVSYAKRLKHSARRSWPGIYYRIVSLALKRDPGSAYNWHMKLRDDFPPSLEDYKMLFKLSFERECSAHFRGLYKDTPLVGMYGTVICHLCNSQMYHEALKWHHVLLAARDFPAELSDTRPLLDYLIFIGDASRVENFVRELADVNVRISNIAASLVRRNTVITREIMNVRLGEVHGVAPIHLSDSFCARLFATRLFFVEAVISGLRMMAVESIGPSSLRELAVRDNYNPDAICCHVDSLRTAGISLGNSKFCAVVRSLAIENKRDILKSVVDCDLHSDTFEDLNLQERLLAQYYAEDDLMKIERTLAVLTTGCSVKDLEKVRMNLILRCQVTLGKTEKVLATLGQLKHLAIPVSTRSSRHLRVCWLSRRQVGRGADENYELGVIIQTSRMSMESGRFVPIIAWREMLRRLGMAGRLTEVENLALWLVDWYSSPAAKVALSKHMLSSGRSGHPLIEGQTSPENALYRDPRRYLSTLFTTAARHAIVAWGFQHFRKPRRGIRVFNKSSMVECRSRLQWTWGLLLLHKLRARGVPIRRRQVAQICRHRLNTLFGVGLSKRNINRRARAESALNSYTEKAYVQKMEEIWGKGLFGKGRDGGREWEKRIEQKPQKQWHARKSNFQDENRWP